MSRYDVIIIGAGPGGIFAAYELAKKAPELKVAVFEAGNSLEKRKCPIDGKKIKSCINCKTCAIMSGFGGAGAFSDGKYNITNDFGGTLYEYIGKDTAIDLMKYVDEINLAYGGEGTKMYSTAGTDIKKLCIQNELKLLDASVRHLGTDINYIVLENLYKELKEKVEFRFNYRVDELEAVDGGYRVISGDSTDECEECIISVGRSGSKWMEKVCESLDIETNSNRVDLGVRVELPAVIFSHLTDELYESKIVYRTEKFEDKVRTFCMNPYGIVVNENTNGIVTVNGHSYEDPKKQTDSFSIRLFSFSSLDGVIEAAKLIAPAYHGANTLYKDESAETFILALAPVENKLNEFNKICNMLSEYGSPEKADASVLAFLEEHCTILISADAVCKLSAL